MHTATPAIDGVTTRGVFWRRYAAFAIDCCIGAVIVYVTGGAYHASRVHAVVTTFTLCLLPFVYRVILHGLCGSTLGKSAVGLSVTRADGSPVGWGGALRRDAVFIVLGLLLFVGTIVTVARMAAGATPAPLSMSGTPVPLVPSWASATLMAGCLFVVADMLTLVLNGRRRALHDFIGGTIVVAQRALAPLPTEGAVAPPTAPWTEAGMAGLGDVAGYVRSPAFAAPQGPPVIAAPLPDPALAAPPPYRALAAAPPYPGLAATRPRSLRGVTVTLWLALGVEAFFAVLSIAAYALRIHVIASFQSGAPVSLQTAVSSDRFVNTIALLSIPMLIIVLVILLVWVHEARKNLDAFPSGPLRFSPGMAVGSFLIPVVSLWWPYLVMREIWRGSDPGAPPLRPEPLTPRRGSPLVVWWWVAFLVNDVFAVVVTEILVFTRGDASLSRLRWTAELLIVSRLLRIVSAALTALLAYYVLRRQGARGRWLPPTPAAPQWGPAPATAQRSPAAPQPDPAPVMAWSPSPPGPPGSTVLGRLKTALARRPLLAYFALAIAGLVVLTVVGATRSSWPAAAAWHEQLGGLTTAVVGLAALACCWATSRPGSHPRRPSARVFLFAAVALATMTLSCIQVVLMAHSAAGNRGFPLSLEVRSVVSSPASWLGAIVAGLVISGVVSSSGVVRRLARALVSWRGPRVVQLGLVALLAPAALAIIAVASVHLAPVKGSTSTLFDVPTPVMFRGSASYAAVGFLCRLLLITPVIFAWYGFVAERLQRRMSPLVAGVVIGLATALPGQIATRIVDSHLRMSSWNVIDQAPVIAGDIVLAVLAVWLTRRARGSLLPAALMLAAAWVAGYGASAWAGATVEQAARAGRIYLWLTVVFVALVVVFGQMWRRTRADEASPAPCEPGPVPGNYEIVVKDLGMPA